MSPSDASPTPPEPERISPPNSFEFSAGADTIFLRLAGKMQFVGLFALVLGVVAIALGLTRRDLGPVISGVLYALIGFWTTRAGSRFRGIALTRGHDVRDLMAALEILRKLYTLQYWVCLVALVAALILLFTPALY